MNFNGYSRFKRTDTVIYDGVETVEVWSPPSFLTNNISNDLIRTYIVPSNHNGRPDLISNKVYGTPYFDWVLLAFNNVTDVLNWPPTGLQLKYPIRSVVQTGVTGVNG